MSVDQGRQFGDERRFLLWIWQNSPSATSLSPSATKQEWFNTKFSTWSSGRLIRLPTVWPIMWPSSCVTSGFFNRGLPSHAWDETRTSQAAVSSFHRELL